MLAPMPYSGMFPPEERSTTDRGRPHDARVDRVDRDVAATIMEHLGPRTRPCGSPSCGYGGAMARVPVEATAYAHRQAAGSW